MSARANAANRQVFMVLQMRVRVARASVQMHYTRSLHPAFYTCCWAGRQTLGVSIRYAECERKMRRVEEREPVPRALRFFRGLRQHFFCNHSHAARCDPETHTHTPAGDYFAIVDLGPAAGERESTL
jgi:hypothetical protein